MTAECALDPGWAVPEAPGTPLFRQMLHGVRDTNFALYVQAFTSATDHRISNEFAKWHTRMEEANTVLRLTYRSAPQSGLDERLLGHRFDEPPEDYEPVTGSRPLRVYDADPALTRAVNQFCEDSGPIDMTDLYRPISFSQKIRCRLRKILHMKNVVYADVTDVQKRVKETAA